MVLADFHIHSNFSDGKLSIPEIIDVFGKRGFGAIAITDHLCDTKSFMGRGAHLLHLTLNEAMLPIYFAVLKSEAQRALEQYNMVVIPGLEITKNARTAKDSSHIVALGVNDFIDPNDNVEDIIDAIHAQEGIAIAAHPLLNKALEQGTLYLWNNRAKLKDRIDAWEVAHGQHLVPEVVQTGLPKIASSDFHNMLQISSWKTVLECEQEPMAILNAIREQKLSFKFFSEAAWNDARTLVLPDQLNSLAGTVIGGQPIISPSL